MYKNVLVIALLLYAVFGAGFLDLLDKPQPNPEPKPPAKILNIDKPSQDVLDRANLGYCQLFKFKCAATRTCDAWLHGGPIRDC